MLFVRMSGARQIGGTGTVLSLSLSRREPLFTSRRVHLARSQPSMVLIRGIQSVWSANLSTWSFKTLSLFFDLFDDRVH